MRIQFWGYPDTPDEALGAAYCEDVPLAGTIEAVLVREGGDVTGTLAGVAARLRPGDLISSGFITDFGSQCPPGTPGAACHAHLAEAVLVSFLMVSGVEHDLAPDGGILAVRVASSLSVPPDREIRDALTVAFTAMGWTVEGLADEREAAARVYGSRPGECP
jgi:hypothetical protein